MSSCDQRPLREIGSLYGRLYKGEVGDNRIQSPDKRPSPALQKLMATHRPGDRYEALADGYLRDMRLKEEGPIASEPAAEALGE